MFATHVKPVLKRFSNILSQRKMGHSPRRALMYVPGSDSRKLIKAFGLNVDCIAMDCEDGVALNKKDEARQTIKVILDKGKPQKTRKYDLGVRVNPVQSPHFQDDLGVILSAANPPDTILLPKVDTPVQLEQFAEAFRKHSTNPINLIIYIESAIGFINLGDICKTLLCLGSNFIPAALVFGSDDFCANIGASRTETSLEILYARQKLVLHAKANQLQAIDMVYIKYKDLEGLQRQCEEGARMGYTGKQVIHPGQVPVVQKAFLPTEAQTKWARGLLEAFEKHQAGGLGAFTFEGSMIDMPTMKQAQNIVDLAGLSDNK